MKKLSCLLVLLVGCGQPALPPSKEKTDPAALALAKTLTLDAEPPGAVGVAKARKDAKDGADVVVAGRVGGDAKPFTEGRASFLFVDPALKPAMECTVPWDYCETDEEELAASRALVRFVDGSGATLKAGAKEMFGIKELSEVVVKGKASRDAKGNLSILATGLYVKKGGK